MTQAAHRFSHQAALYASGDEGAAMLQPFLEDGLSRGVPTIVMVDPDLERAVGGVLGDRAASTIGLSSSTYRLPLAALQHDLNLCRRFLVRGAREVRMVATVPHPGTGADWSGWVRFESAANHFFAELPVSRICAYDLRTTPHHVVEDVRATHPFVLESGGTARPSSGYTAPETLLSDRAASEVDPLEETAPTVELHDASADQARAAVETVARDVPLRQQDVSALCVAADEAITNARRHGRGTVTTRIWRGPNRVAVAVSDQGAGPSSPYAGMLASAGRQGMWLLHQLCTRVSTTSGPDGFTVHLVAQANVPRRG